MDLYAQVVSIQNIGFFPGIGLVVRNVSINLASHQILFSSNQTSLFRFGIGQYG